MSYQVLCSIVLSEWACNTRLSTHVLTHLSLLYIYNIRMYTRTYPPVYVLVNPVSILAHSICICYTMAASGLPVIHEWSVLIGHEGVARVVYQS